MRNLDAVRTAGAAVNMGVPFELLQQYIDTGRNPDDFTTALHAKTLASSDAVRNKQTGFRRLEEGLRAMGGDLLQDEVKS